MAAPRIAHLWTDHLSCALALLACAAGLAPGCAARPTRAPVCALEPPRHSFGQLTRPIYYRVVLDTAGAPGCGNLAGTVDLAGHADDPDGDTSAPAHVRLHALSQGSDALLSTALELFYDATAPGVRSETAEPVVRRDHGMRDEHIGHREVRHALRLDLAEAGITRSLPAGPISVFRRQPDGELEYLGTDPEFGARPWAGSAHAVLGPVPDIRVSRRQTDYALDVHARRLVEEIRLDIVNPGEHDRVLVAHEHMYRGLNWAIAYHNDVGAARKIGPQTIRFDIRVRARATTTLVYRVVYTWDEPEIRALPPAANQDVAASGSLSASAHRLAHLIDIDSVARSLGYVGILVSLVRTGLAG